MLKSKSQPCVERGRGNLLIIKNGAESFNDSAPKFSFTYSENSFIKRNENKF